MPTFGTLEKLVLSFPEVIVEPHFEKISFRVKKKIFVTYDLKNNRATIKLSEIDQDVFSSMNKKAIYPVGNKWGKQGWTFIELDEIGENLLNNIISAAYYEIAPKKTCRKGKTE